jgi:thiol:disulfide interchange protein DsbA
MLRIFAALLFAALPLVAAAGVAPEEGRDYLELPFPQPVETGSQIEVREFFWYGCPHCDALEPVLRAWLRKKPAGVSFLRTPGVAPHWLVHAQAYYTFESLGVVDKVHAAFFDAYHRGQRKLDTLAALADFAAEHGIDRELFLRTFNSFGVRVKVERAKQLNAAYGIHSVPTLVVDGRYVTSPVMAGGNEQVMKVVDELIKRARRERRAAAAGAAAAGAPRR